MFKKSTGKGVSIPAGIGIGLGLSLIMSILGAMLVAYLLITEKMAVSWIGWCAIVILTMASFGGSVVAARVVKGNSLPVSIGVGGGYFLTLLGCTALFFGGQYQGIVATLITVFLGSAGAGIISSKGKNSGIRNKRIRAYR